MENMLENNKDQSLNEVEQMLGRQLLHSEKWEFNYYWDKPAFKFAKASDGKLSVRRKDASKIEGVSNEELWGEDLFKVFGDHINEDGWLTSDWADIIENEVPRFDKHYNDNPEHGETYGRMYMLDYEENEDETMIRPLED